jgi:TonB family protein
MKKLLIFVFLGVLIPTSSWSQLSLSGKLNEKVIEGLVYALDQKKSSPDDILLVRTMASKKFYLVTDCIDSLIVGKEIIRADYTKFVDTTTRIDRDSVYDILWIKKKKYLTLLLPDSGIPFKKLSKRFTDERMDSLKADIKNLLDQAYFDRVSQKYDKLRTIRAEQFGEGLSQIIKDPDIIRTPIHYPEEARMNETQGQVEIAFVLTTSGEVADIYVLKKLGDGCTQAVINAIKELSNKLKAKNYTREENILFLFNINFILLQ